MSSEIDYGLGYVWVKLDIKYAVQVDNASPKNAYTEISWRAIEVTKSTQEKLLSDNEIPASALAEIQKLVANHKIKCSYWCRGESLQAPWETNYYGPQIEGQDFESLMKWIASLTVVPD